MWSEFLRLEESQQKVEILSVPITRYKLLSSTELQARRGPEPGLPLLRLNRIYPFKHLPKKPLHLNAFVLQTQSVNSVVQGERAKKYC